MKGSFVMRIIQSIDLMRIIQWIDHFGCLESRPLFSLLILYVPHSFNKHQTVMSIFCKSIYWTHLLHWGTERDLLATQTSATVLKTF